MNFDSTLSFNIARRLSPERSGAWLSDGPKGAGLGFGSLSLHDAEDPLAEADSWVDKAHLSRPVRTPSLALVFGLGLVYHLIAFPRPYPGLNLLVFAPIADLKSFYDPH